MVQTSARLLALLSLLQVRREWTGQELADRLEVTPRTIRRDVDKLRSLGYPVEAAPGVAGGYRLSAGGELPPLLLDDAEAVAVAVGLRTAASGTISGIEETSVRALAKLEQVLPSRLRRRVSALSSATSAFSFQGPRIDADVLAAIAAACRDATRLEFAYVARDDKSTRRHIEPAAVVYSGHRWYLVAFDLNRDDWRTFRLDRVKSAVAADEHFEPRPDVDPAADVDGWPRTGEVPASRRARVWISPLRARWESEERAVAQHLNDGSVVVEVAFAGTDWLVREVLKLAGDAVVLDPPDAREAVLAATKKLRQPTAAR